MSDADPIRRFFRRHAGAAVGMYPDQKEIDPATEGREERIEWDIEIAADDWKPMMLPESPPKLGEQPQRFIDGCHTGHAIACLRAPEVGWPIPVFLAEVGGVTMELHGRDLVRRFFGVERVISFVTDPFPWDEIEGFASAISRLPEFPLRLLPTDRPKVDDPIDLFDYEKMRKAAQRLSHKLTGVQ